MTPIAIALIVFVSVFGGAIIGLAMHGRLPGHHLDGDSKDVVKLVMGLIGTMAALVLGLLIASAKNTYDTQREHLAQLAADVIEIDRLLAYYGPETNEARAALRQSAIEAKERVWPRDDSRAANLRPELGKGASNAFYESIRNLSPQTDAQRSIKSEVQQIVVNVAHTRLLMYVQLGRSIPAPFLVVLISWLVLLFVGFGLLARINGTVIGALLIGSLSVAGALFLVLELDMPYTGMLRLSSAQLDEVVAQLNR